MSKHTLLQAENATYVAFQALSSDVPDQIRIGLEAFKTIHANISKNAAYTIQNLASPAPTTAPFNIEPVLIP